jgi:hypothetical protein
MLRVNGFALLMKIRYRMLNSALALQKLVLDFGGLVPGYPGPQQTRNR